MLKLKNRSKLEIRKEIIRRFYSTEFITTAIGNATREAVRKHKLAGNPIATWQDGKVVIVQPEDIVVDEG
jgi:hypothetical protein